MRLDEFSATPSGNGLSVVERTRWLCFGFNIVLPVLRTPVLRTVDTLVSSLTPVRAVHVT